MMGPLVRRMILPLLLAASFVHSILAQSQAKDALASARELYASARYDEALAALNTLQPAESGDAISDRKSIEEYRSFCLLALGRDNEADTAIAAVITADPSYQPSETEASPRVRSAFSQVRQRLLPDLVTARYQAAKALFDHKDYASAVTQFRGVLALLDDPDMGGRLPDIKTLAAGFLDLAVSASAPPPAPKPEPVAPPPAPVVPKPDPNHVYSMDDPGVTPPVVVRQDLPRFDPSLLSQAHDHGVLDIVIDEHGRVITLNVREPIQPRYDADLITTARAWRFQPATVNGQPVKFRKLIQINVARP